MHSWLILKDLKYSVILNEIRAYQWQEHVYIRQQSIVLSLWGTVSLTLVLLSLSLFCAFIFHRLPLCPSAPHRHHPPIENSKSGGLGLYAAWPHCCYQLQPADLEWCHPSLPSSSTVCKTTPVYMCVPLICVCVCVCVCACVWAYVCVCGRAYMSGPSCISQEIAGVGLFAFKAQLAAAVGTLFWRPYPPPGFLP